MQISLNGYLFAFESDEELAGIKWWLNQHDIPPLPDKPRSYKEDVRLNVDSFMDVLWVPSELGWHMALPDPWGPQTNHEVASQVWLGSLYFDDPQKQAELRQKMRQVADKFVNQTQNPGGLGWDFCFRYGELDRAWGPLIQWAAAHSRGQNEDGGWLYSGDPALQNKGETSVGTCALYSYVLLQTARISGDEFCLQHGLAALEFMKQFRVPRGAQVWEIPLHAPDVLASAYAVMAFTEGYRITGKSDYLSEAVRWAYTGLPFIYLWSAHDRPAMAYGSIPVFGATWYTSPWFGRVVQWNGLDYAYALLKLSEFDDTLPWETIAEGLTIFGMQIQRTENTAYPGNKGMYPDAYSMMIGDEAYHWDLSPALIMQNVLALTGHDPDVQTQIMEFKDGKLRVNSGMPFSVNLNDSVLAIHPTPAHPDTAFFLVPTVEKPSIVKLAGNELAKVSDVDTVKQGWSYSVDGNVIIKVFVKDESAILEVSPISLIQKSSEPEWNFDHEGYGEGWLPNFHLDEIRVSDGSVQAKSTGIDPWFTGPIITFPATQYDSCTIRMKVTVGSWAQLFWVRNDQTTYNEAKSHRFQIVSDGSYHFCGFSLANHTEWQGDIIQLRFDPTDAAGAEIAIDCIRLSPSSGTVVEMNSDGILYKFRLLPNYPNPFHTGTTFDYELDKPGLATLSVYDVLGQEVIELSRTNQQPGRKTIHWDCFDAHGQPVPAGTYFCRLILSSEVKGKRMVTQKILVLPVRQ